MSYGGICEAPVLYCMVLAHGDRGVFGSWLGFDGSGGADGSGGNRQTSGGEESGNDCG